MKGKNQKAISHNLCLKRGMKKGKMILSFFLVLPFYFLLLGAADLDRQLDIRINNGTQGEDRDKADRSIRLGGQAQQQGNLDKAISYWLEALEIYHQIGDVQAIGRTYDFLGLAYADLGLYREAEDALRRRLGVARANKDFLGQVFGLNNVGTLLLRKGNVPAARKTFDEALSIARVLNSYAGIGLSLNNLGLAAASRGEYDRAIKTFEEALSYRSRASDPVGEANTFNNLGDAYRATNNYGGTISAYGTALRVARSALDRPNEFRAIDGLVATYRCVGIDTRVLDLLQQRLKTAQASENGNEELRSLRLLSEFYRERGKNTEAISILQRAIALAQALCDRKAEAELLGEAIEIGTGD